MKPIRPDRVGDGVMVSPKGIRHLFPSEKIAQSCPASSDKLEPTFPLTVFECQDARFDEVVKMRGICEAEDILGGFMT